MNAAAKQAHLATLAPVKRRSVAKVAAGKDTPAQRALFALALDRQTAWTMPEQLTLESELDGEQRSVGEWLDTLWLQL